MSATSRVRSTKTNSTPSMSTRPTGGLVVLLGRVEHALEMAMMEDLALEGLVPEQWRILSVLQDRPGLSMSELTTEAVLPAASLTRHFDKLVARGLVIRRIHREDRRRVVAALAPAGQAVCERVGTRQSEREQRLRARIGAARFDALVADLALLPYADD